MSIYAYAYALVKTTNIDAQSTKLTFNPNPPLLPNIFSLILLNHCHTDMQLIPLEISQSSRDLIRKARESFLIDLGRTLEPHGMNRRDES